MKKLIIVIGAVALAATVNAAAVGWGGTFSTPDLSDTLPSGTQFALLQSATAFSGAATTINSFTVGGVADNGGTIVDVFAIDDGASDNWEFSTTWANTGNSADGYYAILTLNDTGDKAAYMYLGDISGTTATSPTTYLIYNEQWADLTKSLTTGGYTAAVAPEPTSGLLILLGMAGLALKRKRA